MGSKRPSVWRSRRKRGLTAAVVASVLAAGVATGAADASDTTPTIVGSFAGSAVGVALTDGSLYRVVDQIGARDLWNAGVTGRGVNVAVIDTGVAPVPALSGPDKVVSMVDLSLESTVPEAEYRDTYGHGTHIAGIIAGRDPGAVPEQASSNPHWFVGVAPDAGIVSVKVADNTGAVAVTQVVAGVDWVVAHADELGIDVLNLSYGSGSRLDYRSDPLSAAVERAWKAGITVVVAAGNDGRRAFELGMPARNPYVIAVAGAELTSTRWKVPSWATSGDGVRNPDLAAPGTSIVSLRAPGSRVDSEHPEGLVSEHLFKGTGSSQSAAVVSGAAALLLSARPELTPDQVKALLVGTADAAAISPRNERMSGAGLLRAAAAGDSLAPSVVQSWPGADGSGVFDGTRGTTGEATVEGAAWNGSRWTGSRWTGSRWTGSRWTGSRWTGSRWTGVEWLGSRWTGEAWSSSSWNGSRWTGSRWTDASWTDQDWSGSRWTGSRWTYGSWSGADWG